MSTAKPARTPGRGHHIRLDAISHKKLLVQIAVFGLVLYIFASQLSGLDASIAALRAAEVPMLAFALACVCLTYLFSAGSYYALAGLRLNYRAVLLVQTASGFANRLLPAGLGGMGLFTFFYRRQGYALSEATALVMTNNIAGFIANGLLIVFVLIAYPQNLARLHLPHISPLFLLTGIAVLAAVAAMIMHYNRSRLGQYIVASTVALSKNLRFNRRTLPAVVCNAVLTSLNVLILSLCVSAVAGYLAWPDALLILSAGTLLGAVVPTPGGIGGVEAGLLAGMTAFGVTPAAGLAAVFLYRGLTYWLPILPGLLAFQVVRRQYAA